VEARNEDEVEAEVLRHLEELDATYDLIRIDPEYADTAEFCARYGFALEDSANCIVVASRLEPKEFAACLNLAPTKLDVNKRLRKLMGVRKASFANPDDTRHLTGMMIGGVTPFALPADLPLYVDARVTDRQRVIVGGGSRSLKIAVDPEVFARMERCEVVEDLALEA
jgi:prolyl-tRNA editing enzyme YbaK/EbsC (Cys-tRNA(Pro) deacylase)